MNPMKRLRVLLIDDEFISNLIVRRYLDILGNADYVVQTNGKEALNYLNQCKANSEFPDFIFLDLRMPIMDGFEFLEHYEKMDIAKDIKLHVLTSSLNQDDLNRARKFKSVSGYIQKPLKPNQLAEIIEQ